RFFMARVMGPESLALAVHLRDGGALIGTCAFSQLDGDNGSALYHITIGEKEYWGRGYGTEATELMLEHAFSRLGLHRVALTVFSFNERAVRSYRKVGFVIEGRAREAIWRDGRYWDEISMSVLEDDWRARRLARSRPWSLEAGPKRSARRVAGGAERERIAPLGGRPASGAAAGVGDGGLRHAGEDDPRRMTP
ncbi:MAG TPA: GNAT family protein, partial [Candidatus Limnocylindrales bacterium]